MYAGMESWILEKVLKGRQLAGTMKEIMKNKRL